MTWVDNKALFDRGRFMVVGCSLGGSGLTRRGENYRVGWMWCVRVDKGAVGMQAGREKEGEGGFSEC